MAKRKNSDSGKKGTESPKSPPVNASTVPNAGVAGTETSQGLLIVVKAAPGSRANEIRGWENGKLKVAVTQVAEKGKANKAIIELLAKFFGVSKGRVVLVRGETHSEKTFLIVDLKIS